MFGHAMMTVQINGDGWPSVVKTTLKKLGAFWHKAQSNR